MAYVLKIMNNAEFDRLPYKHVKDALGCADAKAGVAYVRRTGIRPLDAMVTEHELDELVAKVSPHEESGIRYKKWGPTISTIGSSALSLFNPALGALAAGGTTGYQAREREQRGEDADYWRIPVAMASTYLGGKALRGSQAFQAGTAASKAAGGGVIGQTLTGLKGVAGFGTKVGAGQAAAGTLGQTFQAGRTAGQFGTQGAGALGGAFQAARAAGGLGLGGAGAAGAAGAGALTQAFLSARSGAATPSGILGFGGGGAGEVGGGVTGPTGPGGLTVGEQAAPTTLSEKVSKVGDIDSLMQNVKRLGFTSALEQLAPTPQQFQPFQDSQLVQEVLQRVRQGATAPMGVEQREALTFEFDQQRDDTIEALKQRFKALRPGSDISNDSQFRELVTEVESDFAEKKARALAGAQIGLGQTQTEQLSQLAALDVFTLARQADISIQEAQQFKEMIAQLGLAIFPREGGETTAGSLSGF